MIPKIIHYCWLSQDPFPEDIRACMESWKKYLPDYTFMLWNFERFDINSSLWVKQAFKVKKYAFAADFFRLYSLYYYGGIYLDTDVEVLKSFNDLLHLPYFLGVEISKGIEAATMGAEKGSPWVKKCLDYYQNRKFILGIGKYDIKALPSIIKDVLTSNYNLVPIQEVKSVDYTNPNNIYTLPSDYFSPKQWDNPSYLNLTNNTYSIHHFAGSWIKNINKTEKYRNKFSQSIYGKIWRLLNYYAKKIIGK